MMLVFGVVLLWIVMRCQRGGSVHFRRKLPCQYAMSSMPRSQHVDLELASAKLDDAMLATTPSLHRSSFGTAFFLAINRRGSTTSIIGPPEFPGSLCLLYRSAMYR